jgi:hypothetical protein
MRVDVGSPYNCIKLALRYALGNLIRPKYFKSSDRLVTLVNDTEEIILDFPELNSSYANTIAIEDVKSFGQEEFGKFFYEYGRVLFANLIIAITHIDWEAFGEKARGEMRFVADYYDELLKLNNRAKDVLDAFIETIQIEIDEHAPWFDFFQAAREIIKIKQDNAISEESFDVKNTHIFILSYTAAWFSIIGYLLLFCQKTSVDGLSRLTSASETSKEAATLIKAIAESQEDDAKKINICSLIFTYFNIDRYYLDTSGLTIQDPLLELLGKFSSHLMSLVKDEENLLTIIDEELVKGNSEYGPCITLFANRYDPLSDMAPFGEFGILKSDNTNIWAFGKEYVSYYREGSEGDAVNIPSLMEPSLIKYIDKNAPINSYLSFDNVDIEKSFLFIKNIITGVENEKVGVACPGTILQLTIIASTYRTIKESAGFGRLNERNKKIITVGIEMIDMLIFLLYQLWFLSGKFFIQPHRPHYVNDTAVNTLELLREEVLVILEEYFEFIRFKGDKGPVFQSIIKHRLNVRDNISTQDIIVKFHPIEDQEAYVTECANGHHSFILSVLANNINTKITLYGLAEKASKVPLDEEISRMFSRYVEGTSPSFTDIPMIDSMIYSYDAISKHIVDKPFNYLIAVYALLYETIEQLLLKHSVGNYFDFNRADNLVTSYKVETIVSEIIRKPLHVNLGLQDSQQKLTAEEERAALR